MKKLSKKMMISLLTFALVFIALGASTFAWFTLAGEVEVTDVKITVSGGGGLNISLDGEIYTPTLTSEQIQEKIGDILMQDLTSLDGKKITDISGTEQEFEDDKNYIELTLYFQALNVNANTLASYDGIGVFLANYNSNPNFNSDNSGTFITSEGVDHVADINYTNADGEAVSLNAKEKFYAKNALRVSFVQSTNVKYFDFYNEENHNYGDGFSDDETALKGAASYYYEKHKESKDENKKNLGVAPELNLDVLTGEDFTTFSNVGNDQLAVNTNTLVCVLEKHEADTGIDYRGSVTIKIWIEGWDADCYDSIFSDAIKAQFLFKLALFNEEQSN